MKRRRIAASVQLAMSGIILCGNAWGEDSNNPPPDANQQVLQEWQRATGAAGQTPTLVKQDDGSTRLEWHVNGTFDVYTTDVITAGAATTNTPLHVGEYAKSVISSDLRSTNTTSGEVNYFQFGITNTNDRAVLSRLPTQINMLQAGHAGQNFQVTAGDAMANFSGLSSMLSLRGLTAQARFGGFSLTGYSGIVAESWETLEYRELRNQYLRDVMGAKAAYAFSPEFNMYATLQGSSDQGDSLPATVTPWSQPAKIRSATGGFAYQSGMLQLQGEYGDGHYHDDAGNQRGGRATVLDGSYRMGPVGLRAGHHDIDADYASLATSAPPGVRETYGNMDWMASPYLSLGLDVRKSAQRMLDTSGNSMLVSKSKASTLRANINFGPDHPGWMVSLMDTETRGEDASGNPNRTNNFTSSINYNVQSWMTGFSFSQMTMTNALSPTSDSTTTNYQVTLGHSFTENTGGMPSTWNLNMNLSAGLQDQRMDNTGMDTRNVNYMLSLAGQHTMWGQFNLSLTDGYFTQPMGGPNLRTCGYQFDASHALGKAGSIKFYARNTHRNIGSVLLDTEELLRGIQIQYRF